MNSNCFSKEGQEKNLENYDDDYNGNEIVGFGDISEYIERIVKNSGVQEVENLQENEDIEQVGVVERVLSIVVISIISVNFSSMDNIVTVGLELSFSNRIDQEVFSNEN